MTTVRLSPIIIKRAYSVVTIWSPAIDFFHSSASFFGR
jgi:hypothetical protein